MSKNNVNQCDELPRTQLNNMYSNMLQRCQNEDYIRLHPTYRGVKTCDEWVMNKIEFIAQAKSNYYKVGEVQMDLDKDILIKGNKIYSPKTCIFAPHKINTFFERHRLYPLPREKDGQQTIKSAGKTFVGSSKDEVIKQYIKWKQPEIKKLADSYADKIPQRLYKAMTSWTLECSDQELFYS